MSPRVREESMHPAAPIGRFWAGPSTSPLGARTGGAIELVMQLLRTSLATACAAAAGFAIHVLYGRGWAESYTQAASEGGRLAHVLNEPYPGWVVAVAAITALIPTLGKVVIYLLIRVKLPGQRPWQKGLVFGGLLLLMSDSAVRQPFMDVLVGVPADVALVQAVEPWLIQPVMALLIAYVVGSSSQKPVSAAPNNRWRGP